MNVKFHKNCETGEILKISCATCHLVKFDTHTTSFFLRTFFPKCQRYVLKCTQRNPRIICITHGVIQL